LGQIFCFTIGPGANSNLEVAGRRHEVFKDFTKFTDGPDTCSHLVDARKEDSAGWQGVDREVERISFRTRTRILAYHANSVGDVELAQELYHTGLDKAKAEKNPTLIADVYRMRAGMYAVPGTQVVT
jgi:hypothetical protein